MVNNSTNINKMNNHLSPQLIEHKKNQWHDFGNPGAGLEQAHSCGRVKPINGIPILCSW